MTMMPLPRVHNAFNAKILQDLLADYPNLLSVDLSRSAVGHLLCKTRD